MKKILIVDDHPIVLNGLKLMIESMNTYEVVASLTNPLLVFDYLKSIDVDLLITDLEMPEMNGIQLIKAVREKYDCKILVLTMHSERSKLEEAIDLGVEGYLLKDSDKDEFVFALNSISKGKQFYSSSLLESGINKQIESKSNVSVLTERETEVLKLIAEGFSNQEVGEKLFLSPKTIDSHRTNLMKKLEVHNVVELVRYAIKNKIVELG